MKTPKNNIKNQSGEIMLEASLLMFMVIVLLFALLSLFFFFYEQATVINLASEMSSEIGRTYKFGGELEFGDREIEKSDLLNLQRYRTTFKLHATETGVLAEAEDYGKRRLNETGMGFDDNAITIDCSIKSSGIGRNYVSVTVKEETEFFLSGFLEFCGIVEDKTLFTAVSYAECNDLMGYASTTNLRREVSEILKSFDVVGKGYGSIAGLIEAVKKLIGV